MVRSATWSTGVGSVAVLLLVDESPPPDTVAVLVSEGPAFAATFTVTLMGSYVPLAARASARVQLTVASVQTQFVPVIAVAVKPAGSVSTTVTAPLVGAAPTL